MSDLKTYLFLFLSLSIHCSSLSQVDTVNVLRSEIVVFQDSVFIPDQDTVLLLPHGIAYQIKNNQYARSDIFYDSLRSKAYKSKVKKELYKLLVTQRPPQDVLINRDPVKSESFFKAYEGKRIQLIKIVRVDMFSGSVADTTSGQTTSLEKVANKLHYGTRNHVIIKNLLFTTGDLVDPFQIADGERVIRSLPFIQDARIQLALDPKGLDTVDVYIIIKDRFPWSLSVDIGGLEKFKLGIANKNLLGTGNEIRLRYLHNEGETISKGYDVSYTWRNIHRSFIDFTAFIAKNYNLEGRGLLLKKDFVSPEIKYGGEATIEYTTRYRDLVFADSTYVQEASISKENYDLWVARSFQISKRRNLSLALRFFKDDFISRPLVRPDSNDLFHNRDAVLASISFTKLNYLKTKNILSFNITEDVPIGYIHSLVAGRDWAEFGDRYYLGWQSGFARHFDTGYFAFNFEAGTFFSKNRTTNNVLEFRLGYMTPLLELGKSSVRSFFKLNYFLSNNLTIPISRSLKTNERIRNIDGRGLSGQTLLSGTLESALFLPWYFYGFRFAPYLFTDFGFVQESRIRQPFSNFFYGIGSGIRIRNESLVFDTFEIRAVFFPQVPEDGNRIGIAFSASRPILFDRLRVNKPKLVALDN